MIVAAVLVLAVVVVGIVTGAQWWGWLLVAALVAAVGARQEVWNRRVRRRIDRHSRHLLEASAAVTGVTEEIRSSAATTRALTERLAGPLDVRLRREYEQVQAAINLFARVEVAGRVPPMRGWAASPDVLLLLVDEFLARRPSVVVECGGGVSTLWLALAARQYGVDCRIVSLDHTERFLEQTRSTLEQHGVADRVELRHAPLVPTGLPDHEAPWYDVRALDDVHDVGLVFVDGPPEKTGPLARYPALPMLLPHLAEDVLLVLDDAVRSDEKAAVARWLEEVPGLTATTGHAEKGVILVERTSGHVTS